jgi:transposase InsO family protein
MRFLIRDRGGKYSARFDRVLRSSGIRIVQTPVRAPKANVIAERFVRTVRVECLDWLLILNHRHVERVLGFSSSTTTRTGRIRALKLQSPQPREPGPTPTIGEIGRLRSRSVSPRNPAVARQNGESPRFAELRRCRRRDSHPYTRN